MSLEQAVAKGLTASRYGFTCRATGEVVPEGGWGYRDGKEWYAPAAAKAQHTPALTIGDDDSVQDLLRDIRDLLQVLVDRQRAIDRHAGM